MFNLSGRLSPIDYAYWAVLATALFAVSMFGFPYFLSSLLRAMACGQACGVVGIGISASAKPLLFYGYVALLAAITVQRVRDLGLPAALGLFVPMMAIGDSAFGVYAGASWAFAFSYGVLSVGPPYFLAFTLACIAFLCVAPSQSLRYQSWGAVSAVAAVAAIFLSVCAVLRASTLWAFALLPVSVAWLLLESPVATLSAMLIFALAIVALSRFGSRSAPAGRETAAPSEEVAPSRANGEQSGFTFHWRPRTSLKIAGILTASAMVLGYRVGAGGVPFWLWALPMAIVPVIVPTFLLYLLPIAAATNCISRPGRVSAALCAASLLPFGLWAYDVAAVYRLRSEEAAAISAIPTVALDHVPDTLVIDGENVFCARIRDKSPGLKAIIEVSHGQHYMREDCATAERQGVKRQPVAALPDERLLLLAGRESHFADPHKVYDALGQPLELRYVAPGRDDLLAVSYRAWKPYPAAPPILTSAGWLRAPNSVMSDNVSRRLTQFIVAGLLSSPTAR